MQDEHDEELGFAHKSSHLRISSFLPFPVLLTAGLVTTKLERGWTDARGPVGNASHRPNT